MLDLRDGERRPALGAFFTLFGITAAHTLLETARDALFLAKLPASRLPWTYLAIAGVGLVLARVANRGKGKKASRRAVSIALAIAAAVNSGFWLLRSVRHPILLYALYVWAGIFATWVVVQFWLLLDAAFTVAQAKRLFGFIGAGAVLGAVSGASLARGLTPATDPAHLLLVAAVVLVATAIGPARFLSESAVDEPRHRARTMVQPVASLRGDLRLVSSQPYLRRMLGLVLLSAIALTMVDYVFKASVANHVAKRDLAAFFATTYVVFNAMALVVQVIGVGWLLRVLGVHRALLVMPAVVILGACGVAVTGTLAAALLMKGADGALRYSLNRTSTELLYLPIAEHERPRAKPFIDLLGQRGGQALASLVILGVVAAGAKTWVIPVLVVALGAAWIAVAASVRGRYLDLFRATLRQGRLDPSGDIPELDLGALESLITALSSRKDAEVLGALDLLAAQSRRRLIPVLILYHPSKLIVLRALALLVEEGHDDFVPVADRLLSHEDAEVRAAALRAMSAVAPDEAFLRARLGDECHSLRATAVVALIAHGWLTGDESRRELGRIAADPAPAVRVALARAIAQQPSSRFEATLIDLAQAEDVEVRTEVAAAMGKVKSPRFLPVLLRFLGVGEVAAVAGAALVSLGEPALEALVKVVEDGAVSPETRWNAPRAISRFDPTRAAPILLHLLQHASDGVTRYRSLRGLCLLRAEDPSVPIDRAALLDVAETTLRRAYANLDARIVLERGRGARATPAERLLVTLLRDKESNATARLFRLLGLLYPKENFDRIYRGLSSKGAKTRASSRELCENVVSGKLRSALLILVDDLPDEVRLDRAAPFYVRVGRDYGAEIRALAERSAEVSVLACHHAREIGLSIDAPRAPGNAGNSALALGVRELSEVPDGR